MRRMFEMAAHINSFTMSGPLVYLSNKLRLKWENREIRMTKLVINKSFVVTWNQTKLSIRKA